MPEDKRERVIVDRVIWCASFLVAGGLTITQGPKVLLAYLATHRLSRREWLRLAGVFVALVVAGFIFYMARRVWFSDGGYTVKDAIDYNLSFIVRDMTLKERLVALEMFFFEPIIPHGAPLDVFHITEGYGSALPYVACAALYAGAVAGAWRLRRTRLLRMLAAGFSIDILIHFVFFWGMNEGQIYCGHWFYMLPILLAGAVAPRGRRMP